MKICLTFSPGGHYSELINIIPAFEEYKYFNVTIKKNSTKNIKNSYYVPDTIGKNIIDVFKNFYFITIKSFKILLEENPDVIFSIGADVTIPICLIGKLMGKKLIYIESICRIKNLSFTGKILYFFSDLFLVQWNDLSKKYIKAKYWGNVL